MKPKERISFLVTGFGATAQDYDFRVTDTATGAGVHVVGDQPVTRLNIFSIDKVQSIEPYIAIDLEPGQEKRWSYRYTYTAAGIAPKKIGPGRPHIADQPGARPAPNQPESGQPASATRNLMGKSR